MTDSEENLESEDWSDELFEHRASFILKTVSCLHCAAFPQSEDKTTKLKKKWRKSENSIISVERWSEIEQYIGDYVFTFTNYDPDAYPVLWKQKQQSALQKHLQQPSYHHR